MDPENVVRLPLRGPAREEFSPPVAIPLHDVEAAKGALDQTELAIELAQATLAKADTYGEDVALTAVKQIFTALAMTFAAS